MANLRQSKVIGEKKGADAASGGRLPKKSKGDNRQEGSSINAAIIWQDAEPTGKSTKRSTPSLAPAVPAPDVSSLLPSATAPSSSPAPHPALLALLVTDEEELQSSSQFKHYAMACLKERTVAVRLVRVFTL